MSAPLDAILHVSWAASVLGAEPEAEVVSVKPAKGPHPPLSAGGQEGLGPGGDRCAHALTHQRWAEGGGAPSFPHREGGYVGPRATGHGQAATMSQCSAQAPTEQGPDMCL